MALSSPFETVTTARERESRSSLENPQTPLSYPAEWLLDVFNGGRTDSGIRVSELTAFQCVTFLSGVDLISGTISSRPCHVYERTKNVHGRTIDRLADDHAYYDLVNLEPNDEMSQQTFIKAFLCHCLAWGNGYAEIQRDGGNGPVAFWPRNPYKTKPHRVATTVRLDPVSWRPFPVVLPAGTLCYKTTDGVDDQSESGANYERLIPKEDMLHVPGLTLDGRIGQSAVWLARHTLGLALAAEKFGGKYFANFAKPGGILEMPMVQNAADREKTKASFIESQGGENAHRIAVVPPGTKFTPISNNPQDSQSVETQRFIRQQIGALLHVPPHMLGDTDKGKANTEQMAQELIQYTFSPWISALEQEYKRKLFPHSGIGRTPRNRFYMRFDVSALIRPDSASREKFNSSMKQWGNACTNDIRGLEGMPPIDEPWAEQYWMPINMTLTTTPVDPTHQDGAGNGTVPDKKDQPEEVAA